MNVEIRIANDSDAKEWDTIISQSPDGTFFHQWKWLKIAEKHTGMKLYPLIGIKDNIPIGLFPLFFQKKGPVRLVFSPPPHAAIFYLGPIIIGYDSLKQQKKEKNYHEFQNSVEHFIIHDLEANYISIILPPYLQDLRPFVWSGYSIEPQYDYITDISIGPESLLQTLDKKLRQNLNRAIKRGITVETGGKKEFEIILDLMDIRYAQQAKYVTAKRDYFLEIYDEFKDNMKIFVAKVDGEVITGNIDFQYRNGHYSWIGNPKPKNPISPSPNDLLIWESVRYAYDHGFKYYITMSAAGDRRLHEYYASKFNPELKINFLVKKTTFIAKLLEKGYSDILKPWRGRMKQITSEK
jgi:hypothetical protein